jgi:hypothetical protein
MYTARLVTNHLQADDIGPRKSDGGVMTSTLTPIHHRQSSVRSGTVMLFGNPPGVTPIHHRQASPQTGTVMLFGNPPSAARPGPGNAPEGGASA